MPSREPHHQRETRDPHAFKPAGDATSDQVPTSQPGVYQARSYAWDDSDRLRSVTAGGSVETYLYAADGMRWQKSTGSVTTTYAPTSSK